MEQESSTPVNAAPNVAASDLVAAHLNEYRKYIMFSKFPSFVTGLKLLMIRFLWSYRNTQGIPKSMKAISLVAETHDHGESSIYEALVRGSQTWEYRPPLVLIEGNNGNYTNSEPAASRYTGMTIHPFARRIFFDGIDDSAIPMRFTRDANCFEPIYLIPAIPTTLLYDDVAVGFADGSRSIPHNIGDVCDLAIEYALHQARSPSSAFDYKKHLTKFLPDFPTASVLTNADELLNAYRDGNWTKTIHIHGKADLYQDKIVFMSIADNRTFSVKPTLLDKLTEEATNKNAPKVISSLIEDEIFEGDSVKETACVEVRLRKGVNVFTAWEVLQKIVSFTGCVTPNLNFVDENAELLELTPPELLSIWYAKRRQLVVATKRRRLAELYRTVWRIEARLIVALHTDEILPVIRVEKKDEIVKFLRQKYHLSLWQCDVIFSEGILSLNQYDQEKLRNDYVLAKEAVAKFAETFSRVDEEIADDIRKIKKQYSMPRTTTIPKYIGYVSIDEGIIQVESTTEIEDIIERFPSGKIEVHSYDGPHLLHISPLGKVIRNIIPKVTRGDVYGFPFSWDKGYTVQIQDGCGCCVRGVLPAPREVGYFYTSKKAMAVTRTGVVKAIDVTEEFSYLKNIGRGRQTDIVHIYPYVAKPHYVAVFNDTTPNTFLLHKVSPESQNVGMSPVGKPLILNSETGKDWYFTLPKEYTNRCAARVFCIVDAEGLLAGNSRVKIEFMTNKIQRSPHFATLS